MNNHKGEGNLTVLAFPKISEMEQFISACLKKPITIEEIVILRQRDFSVVARMELKGESEPVIYKKVITPWHCEADVMLFLQDSKLPNSARLIGTRKATGCAQILQEDAGEISLLQHHSSDLAYLTGLMLAQTHDATLDLAGQATVFPRLDNQEKILDCFDINIFKLRALYPQFADTVANSLKEAGENIAEMLAEGPFCLQHGDMFGENIVLQNGTTPVFIDWSYFSIIAPRLYDLSTLTSSHAKNGGLHSLRQSIIEGYATGAGLDTNEIERQLPAVYRFSRLLFLQWLLTRVEMGITETTVGPVQPLIEKVVGEIIN
ncbi:hypothetical protein BH11CYA1_BH11CYA1_33580 [soil metagenome]